MKCSIPANSSPRKASGYAARLCQLSSDHCINNPAESPNRIQGECKVAQLLFMLCKISVPISRTRKKNQSVKLDKLFECQRKQIEVWWKRLYLRATTTVRRNHVWCDGNKYTKQRRGWSSRKWRVACVRDFLVTILDNIQLHRLSVCIASMIINERLTLWSVD